MTDVLQAIEQASRGGPLMVESLIASTHFPHVQGRTVTFLFRGDAHEVSLHHWIHGLPGHLPFRRLGGGLWVLQIDLPAGSRMEYKIGIGMGGRGMLVRDPLNEHTARDPFGANSVVYGEGYELPDWVVEDPEARKGSLEDFTMESKVFGEERTMQVYLPARFRSTRRYPLLVVHDGRDYLGFSSLQNVLDNLIHRLEIPPVVAVMLQSGDRLREDQLADDRHAEFLVGELVPQLEERYPLVRQPAARGVMGASFGAVAALQAAWRNPGFFGKLLLQSGSFVFTEIGEHDKGPLFDPVVSFVNEFRREPGKPAEQVYLSCGVYEGLIYYNRSLVPLLQETGMQVRFREANDGHNWENWRDRLREGLSWLFPGPLWMVYE